MNAALPKRPDTVAVRSQLQDGGVVTVTATRRPRAGRADIKCSAPGAPQLAARMAQVAHLARHTEARHDSRDQVVISMDRAPGELARDWELAVVLADRAVRGLLALPGGVLANGWSAQWQIGRIDGHDVDSAAPGALRGGPGHLHHLGALTGQPDVAASVSSARAWFPLHSGGINDALCWVEVSVYPLARGRRAATRKRSRRRAWTACASRRCARCWPVRAISTANRPRAGAPRCASATTASTAIRTSWPWCWPTAWRADANSCRAAASSPAAARAPGMPGWSSRSKGWRRNAP